MRLGVLGAVVLDIDDTLINPSRRMQAIWHEVLGREVPLEAVKSLELEQVFMTYASAEQKTRASSFQRRFWDLVLCLDKLGVQLLELDEPMPFASDVVQKWSQKYGILYLTGRTENTRRLTINELAGFGFPIDDTSLFMVQVADYARMRGENPTGPNLTDAKSQVFSSVALKHKVVRVVDDFPDYFPIYKQSRVPDRIGLRTKRFPPEKYLKMGATRIIENWNDL